MDIIYAPSYQSFNLIFFLKYIKKKEIYVISNNQEVLEICLKLNIKVVHFYNKNYKFKSIKDKKDKLSLFYNQHIINKDTIWLSHNNHDTLGYLFMLVHIKNNGKVLFVDLDPQIIKVQMIELLKFFFTNIKHALYKIKDFIILKFFFKLSISLGKVSSDGNITFVLNNVNQSKNKFQLSSYSSTFIRNNVIQDLKINYLNKYNLNIIFGGTKLFHENFLKKNSENKIKNIINNIDNCYYKPHPNKDNFSPIDITKVKIISNSIPFLLLVNSCKSVISISSAVLVDILSRKDVKSISLLNLVEWNDVKEKKRVKNYLEMLMKKRNLHGIYFPNSISELKRILDE